MVVCFQYTAIFSYLMIFIIKYNELVMKDNRIRLTESQFHNVIRETVKRILRESSDEERINAAVEALMSVRDVVSAAARKCGFKMGSKTALEKAIINANNAIEAVFGFSHYGDELRAQRDIEQYEQD